MCIFATNRARKVFFFFNCSSRGVTPFEGVTRGGPPPLPLPRHATEPKGASAWDEAEEPIGSKVSLEEKRYREFQAFQWRERALISSA